MPLAPSRSKARLEVQALRAAAVLVVIGFHFWPGAFRGGFVGVDVFFVISGFLITSQLVKELRASGSIAFAGFYARRARRILPAALTVLAVCLVATFAVSSPALWADQLRHIVASTLFFENWALALQSVDYLAAIHEATPVQHYWSLSVEEQFYLFWPALLLAVYWLATRVAPRRRWLVLTVALALVFAASLSYSLAITAVDAAPAFFNTAARAWEFSAGALVACLGTATSARVPVRRAAAAVGWLAIAASVLFVPVALVSVVGAVLVIWAGVHSGSRAAARLFDSYGVRLVAEVSFSAYLWHWPVLIFARQLVGDELSHLVRLVLLALVFVLAIATTALVERPIRYGRLSRSPLRFTAVLAALLTIAVAVPASVSLVVFERTLAAEAANPPRPAPGVCVGAEAVDPQRQCTDGPYSALVPNPLILPTEVSVLHSMGCAVHHSAAGVISCEFGDLESDIEVALVGDSHAMKMWPAVKRLAEENGWHLTTFLRGACMYTDEPSRYDVCEEWRGEVSQRLDEQHWDLIFTATTIGIKKKPGPAIAGLQSAWQRLTDDGAQVIVIKDNPRLPESPRRCEVDHGSDVSVCDVPRAEVDFDDIQVLAATGQEGVHVVDLTPFYCDAVTCFVSAGGVLLYMDSTHINDEYAVTLAPYIAEQVEVFAPEFFDKND